MISRLRLVENIPLLFLSILLVAIITASAMTTTTTATKTIAPLRVAILGGGVGGCAAARRLAQWATSTNIATESGRPSRKIHITLYEIGRGPGGRASTRKTRALPHIYINHGAPYADIRSTRGRSLISTLGPSGTIVPFDGVRGSIDATTGAFSAPSNERDGSSGDAAAAAAADTTNTNTKTNNAPMYITGASGEMSDLSTSLLAGFPSSIINTQYKTMIRGLSRITNTNNKNDNDNSDGGGKQQWELRDKSERVVGVADWLVIAGSGVAHPRWSKTFGGEPPLIEAEQETPDPTLRQALDSIAKVEVSPVLAVFFSCSGSMARQWLALKYSVLDVKGSSVLSRVMIQGGGGGAKDDSNTNEDENDNNDDCWCSIVLHSTENFALENTGVYGASSSAARTGGAASNVSKEEILIKKMMVALTEIPGMPTQYEDYINNNENGGTGSTDETLSVFDYGPALHRWGNAFPKGDPLSEELSFLPSSRLAFCGDYVATSEQARLGSFESALLSGNAAGENIAKYYQEAEAEAEAQT
mmetsp:Transcript_49608/g.55281  ORF Transcript_49608/g.55281 Transcript_49608/m.55281 type:complete len:531 (+) Transcript_49608:69-1661(+)